MKTFLIAVAFALSLAGCSKDTAKDLNTGDAVANSPVEGPSTGNGTGTVEPDPSGASGGPVGTFNGYIQRADGILVPLSLQVETKHVPDSSGSRMKASLRVGMFGGVTLGTDQVVYALGSGRLVATFASSTGTVEVSGSVRDGQLLDAVIVGNQSLRQNVVLSTDAPSLFTDETDTTLSVSFPGSSMGSKGVMNISNSLGGTPSNHVSDLDQIPALAVTVRFNGMASALNSADKVAYDPLTGKMDVFYSTGGRLHFEHVGLKSAAGDYGLEGQVLAGAAVVSQIQATPTRAPFNDRSAVGESVYYVGSFKGSESYLTYRTAAQLTYRSEESKNPAESVFPEFPKMTLLVYICGENDTYARMIFDAVSTKAMNSRILFREAIGTQNMDYDVSYSGALATLAGPILSPQTAHGSSGQMSRLELTAVPAASWKGCR